MKKISSILIVFALFLISLAFMPTKKSVTYFGGTTVTDQQIQDYIQSALVNGCRPVINICDSDCGRKDITKDVKAECLPAKVLMISKKRAEDNYFKLAEKNGVRAMEVEDLPNRLREKLSTKGVTLSPIKEALTK